MVDSQRPGISASPDDAAGRRTPNAGSSTATRRRGAEAAPRGIGLNLVLAVMAAGLMIAGWFLANQHEMLKANQIVQEAAERRIVTLEDRLRVTDEAMTETGEDTKEKIGYWESEIRKLWSVSNERNKKWIQDNQSQLETTQKTLNSLELAQRELKASIARHEASLTQQAASVDQLLGMEAQLKQLLNTQRDLVDKVNSARQSVASLQAGLSNRVSDNEQAITAIDAYRLQINGRVAALERRLGP